MVWTARFHELPGYYFEAQQVQLLWYYFEVLQAQLLWNYFEAQQVQQPVGYFVLGQALIQKLVDYYSD